MRRFRFVLGPVLALALIGVALAADTSLALGQNAKLGTFFTDSKGMTLYAFTKDVPNKSNCTGGCLQAWPPLTTTGAGTLPAGTAGTVGTIARSDGTTQVTYNDMPLYYWAKDKAPGDTTGQGVGGVWFVVAPGATFATLAGAAPSALPKTGGMPIELLIAAGVGVLGIGVAARRIRPSISRL